MSNLRTGQPGTRWSRSGVQAVLSLALCHGQWWTQFFTRRPPVRSLSRPLPTDARHDDHTVAA